MEEIGGLKEKKSSALSNRFLVYLLWGISVVTLLYLGRFYLEEQLGLKVDFLFGSFWQKRFIFPVFFWLGVTFFTFSGTCFFNFRQVRSRSLFVGESLRLGFFLHLSFLLVQLIQSRETDFLNSKVFVLYAYAVCILLLAAISAYGIYVAQKFLENTNHSKDTIHPLMAPLSCIPFFVTFVVGIKIGAMVTFAAVTLFALKNPLLNLSRKLLQSNFIFPSILFLIASAFRVVAAYRLGSMGLKTVLLNSDDAEQYYAYSNLFFAGKSTTLQYSLGGIGWLAFFRWLTHDSTVLNLVLQSLVLSSVPVGVFWIGGSVFDPVTGAVAGILAALSELMIFNSVNWTREGPANFFSVILLFFITCYLKFSSSLMKGKDTHFSFCYPVMIGILGGLLVITDYAFFPILILFFSSLLIVNWKLPVRNEAKSVLLSFGLVLCMMCMARWLFTGELGLVLRKMNDIEPGEFYSSYSQVAKQLYGKRINLLDFPGEFFHNIFLDPIQNTQLFLAKVWLDFRRYFFESQSGSFDPILLVRNSVFAANLNFYGYLMGIVGFITGLKLFREVKAWRCALLIYLLPIMHVLFFSVVIFGYTRFRATLQPMYLIFVSLGMVKWFTLGKAGQGKQSALRP